MCGGESYVAREPIPTMPHEPSLALLKRDARLLGVCRLLFAAAGCHGVSVALEGQQRAASLSLSLAVQPRGRARRAQQRIPLPPNGAVS